MYFKLFIFISFFGYVLLKGCKDQKGRGKQCRYWKRLRYCSNTYYINQMKQYCQKTCGLCSKAPRGSTCNDKPAAKRNCHYWKQNGNCRVGQVYYQYMSINCRKTCGFCGGGTPQVVIPKCSDKKSKKDCLYWKNRGNCRPGQIYYTFMRNNCQQTCQFCPTVVKTTKATTTTTKPTKKTTTLKTTTTTKPTTKAPQKPETWRNWKEMPCGKDLQSIIAYIIGGHTAKPNRWIWQAGLYLYGDFICGGSLITPKHVITAAHCFRDDFENLVVKFGDHDRTKISGKEQIVKVVDFITHEKYNSLTFENDIAILELQDEVILNESVGLVCLPNQPIDIRTACYITGWGRTVAYGDSAEVLQEAQLDIISNDKCKQENSGLPESIKLSNNMLCAGKTRGNTNASGCQGDSGGPLVCKKDDKWILQGAVSWGSADCDTTKHYTVFARISNYVDWIEKNLK